MAKSTKIIVALSVAGALGVAALPMASYAAHTATETEIQDEIKIQVASSCKFTEDNSADKNDKSIDYAAALNGGDAATELGSHKFNVYCNDNQGFDVKAVATSLDGGALGEIAYVAHTDFSNVIKKDTDEAQEGDQHGANYLNGAWTATATTDDDNGISANASFVSGGKVATKAVGTPEDGSYFTATYKAYAGPETKAGAYVGTITYTLTHPAV